MKQNEIDDYEQALFDLACKDITIEESDLDAEFKAGLQAYLKNKSVQMDLLDDYEELERSAQTGKVKGAIRGGAKKEVCKTEQANDNTKKVYAYVRVSDSKKQDSATQRHVIQEYVTANSLSVTQWQEFNLSGSKTSSKDRGIDDLLASLKPNDIVLVSDIARLGRDSVHQVLNTITSITTKGASVHFCYSKTAITPEQSNDIAGIFMAIGEAYAAVKFAEERSQKAKAACERRAKAGLHNGRRAGAIVKSKLDDHALFIISELEKGTKKLHILSELHSQGVDVTRMSLYRWIDRRLGGKGINKEFHSSKEPTPKKPKIEIKKPKEGKKPGKTELKCMEAERYMRDEFCSPDYAAKHVGVNFYVFRAYLDKKEKEDKFIIRYE